MLKIFLICKKSPNREFIISVIEFLRCKDDKYSFKQTNPDNIGYLYGICTLKQTILRKTLFIFISSNKNCLTFIL